MNPILKSKYNLYIYTFAWIFIAIIQSLILLFYFNLELKLAVMDSLVFNSLFFIIGLLIWYPVRFLPMSKRNAFNIFINHLALGVLVISAWISSGFFILKALFSEKSDMMQSIVLSMPYRIISGILLFILILMVYYLIVFSRYLKEKIQNEAKLQDLVREAELNMLKFQINPHFLFNSLNSVSYLTMSNPAGAREMIIKLSEFLRVSLKYSETNMNPLRDEIENIGRYLDIEKVRFEDRLNFSFECNDLTEEWLVPNMILQPLFENAVKHGVYESLDPINIKMTCEIKHEMLYIYLSNNFDIDNPGRMGAGIGLNNIGERLKLIYRRNDLLKYEKTNGLFNINLMIPAYAYKGLNN